MDEYRMEVKQFSNPLPGALAKLISEIADLQTEEMVRRIGELASIAYKAGYEMASTVGPADEWSNNSCLGYVIAGMKGTKYEGDTQEIVSAVRGEFDWKTLEEAKRIYDKSPY